MTNAATARLLRGAVPILLLAVTIGCGRMPPRLVAVEGTITCDGKPVPTGAIVLVPDSDPALGEGRSSIDERGRFSIRNDRHPQAAGVPTGRYRISVFASRPKGGDPLAAEYEMLVPGKYANPETSGLVVDVSDGQDRIDLDLDLTGSDGRSP